MSEDHNQAISNIEEEVSEDLKIDESNLVGESRKQKDLMYKWASRLAKVSNEWKKTLIEIDVTTRELYSFYSTDYKKALSPAEVKIYVAGDKTLIELRDKKRKLELLSDIIKGAVASVKERGKTISLLVQELRYRE